MRAGAGVEQVFEQRGAFSTGDAPGDDPAAENIDANMMHQATIPPLKISMQI
ncbi:MAG: hypothetical protein ACREC9_12350 [Methylocella sp.]